MSERTYTYKTAGGCLIRADVYRPESRGACPVIVWPHGGALIFGSRRSLEPRQRDLYLSAGYAVVALDYRLAPETHLPEIISDLRDGFAWLHRESPGLSLDPERLAVVGHSAGGYLTLMAGALMRQPRPRALVSLYGYGDILDEWYRFPDAYYRQFPLVSEAEAQAAVGSLPLSELDDQASEARFQFYLYCRQQGLWLQKVVGHDPQLEPERFDPYRPIKHVTADYPPTLLVHGDLDTDVPYEQSVLMAKRLGQAGVEHELVTVTGGGHGFDRSMETADASFAFQKVLRFLDKHL